MFAGYFRPNLDLRSITGGNALREIQTYVRDFLNVAHWNLPTDNAGIRRILCNAVAEGTLIPVINCDYRGLPRVAQPDPAPQYWPATGGGGGYAYRPRVLTGSEFQALQRANGELGSLGSIADGGELGATLNPLPDLGAPGTAVDDFDLLGVIESAAGALLGGGDDDPDSGVDASDVVEEAVFSGDSGDSTLLGDAQPFDYQPDGAPAGDSFDIAKPPNEGDPGTWYTNSGSGQMRMYGERWQAGC